MVLCHSPSAIKSTTTTIRGVFVRIVKIIRPSVCRTTRAACPPQAAAHRKPTFPPKLHRLLRHALCGSQPQAAAAATAASPQAVHAPAQDSGNKMNHSVRSYCAGRYACHTILAARKKNAKRVCGTPSRLSLSLSRSLTISILYIQCSIATSRACTGCCM